MLQGPRSDWVVSAEGGDGLLGGIQFAVQAFAERLAGSIVLRPLQLGQQRLHAFKAGHDLRFLRIVQRHVEQYAEPLSKATETDHDKDKKLTQLYRPK